MTFLSRGPGHSFVNSIGASARPPASRSHRRAGPGAKSKARAPILRRPAQAVPQAVEQATEARLLAATATSPARLMLLTRGKIVAVYIATRPPAATTAGHT